MIYNGHSLQGADNAMALIGKEPKLDLLSLDPALLVFCVVGLVLCIYAWRHQGKERNTNKTPNILSWRELLFLLCSGPSLMFLAVALKEQFSLSFPLSAWVSFAFFLQGYIALRFIFSRDAELASGITEERQMGMLSGTRGQPPARVLRFLVAASTIVGGGIIFLLLDIFLLHCRFTQMGPCPGF